jgi:hypothetical protein
MSVRHDNERLLNHRSIQASIAPTRRGFGQTTLNDPMTAANTVSNDASDDFHYVLKVPLKSVAETGSLVAVEFGGVSGTRDAPLTCY